MWRLVGSAILLALAPAASAQVSTDPTTRELLSIVDERSKAEETRIAVQEKSNDQRFEAQEKAVAAALAAAKEAVTKAEVAAEKRFDAVNEFRGQLKDQTATFISRTEVLALMKAIEDRVQSNDARITQVISRAEGVNWLWGLLLGVGGLIIGSISVAAVVGGKAKK